jgi:predicted membrane protein
VALGLLFLLGNMGFVDVREVFRFWPVILIAFGVLRIVEYGGDYGSSGGIFWIVIGSFFLLGSVGILRVAARDLWPVMMIAIGALMLWRTTLAKRERTQGQNGKWDFSPGGAGPAASGGTGGTGPGPAGPTPASSNSILSATAIMGGVERRNNSQDFRGGDATAIMGGCEIDLRAASITSPHEPVLEVFALWGGIEIRVPPDWTVVSKVSPMLGGYEDHTQPPKDESKRLVIRGTVVMGGIEVTN